MDGLLEHTFCVKDYDLGTTLSSGQVFRWVAEGGSWTSVIGDRWVRLRQGGSGIIAEAISPVKDWEWLKSYLQTDLEIDLILTSFPKDRPLREAIVVCRGLRLLRQEPWECLASFILSSTKQIVQIQQIIGMLCRCFGEEIPVPYGSVPAYSFPRAKRIASLTEADLRSCKMGFRAKYLLEASRIIATGGVNLNSLSALSLVEARDQLMLLPGVGRKIADCVLLFAFGFQEAFPVDIWIMKALRQLYFSGLPTSVKALQAFAESHFGPHAGYAQQYLFHYMRTGQSRVIRSRDSKHAGQ